MQLGDPAWLAAAAQAVDASEEYRRRAAGWRWPLGLGFVDAERYAVLDLHDGHCAGARPVDRREFAQAPFRLSGSVEVWQRVLRGRTEPMRCILLHQLELAGDRLTALRYLPAAKAMLDAMATVDTDLAVR